MVKSHGSSRFLEGKLCHLAALRNFLLRGQKEKERERERALAPAKLTSSRQRRRALALLSAPSARRWAAVPVRMLSTNGGQCRMTRLLSLMSMKDPESRSKD